ncbi:MAG: OmpA family protein [Muribaculaceae bacterium]|nr:OmpA family protein [Muribaculaceae bacterium]
MPKKNMAAIVDKQKREAKRLKAAGIPVELTRNGEVIVATIGAEGLFLPNSTELRQSAGNFLRPFTPMLTQAGMWKVLVVMHSDDTGSEEYVNSLTEARAESVCKWFEALSLDTSAMVPYGCGADEPLLVNNSRLNRGANRRLEVYLIPGLVMLDMAKRGMIP